MKSVSFLILFLVSHVLLGTENKNSYLGVSVRDIETTLENHLNDWYPRIIDNETGGFFTNFENNWEKSDEQTKMLVTQARGLWTAAKAANKFPDNELYQSAARHGYHFITTKMWDEKDGGFNLFHIKKGEKQLHKLLYANAFALFALAEYAKTEPSDELFLWLQKLFNWIESAAHDDIYGGYYNLILSEEMEIINTHKTWWSQFEAWHTLALMHQYFPNNEKYKTAFGKMWTYINKEITDHEYGGFYNNGIDTSANEKKKRKAHIWKGSYHDGRALMNVRDYAIDYND